MGCGWRDFGKDWVHIDGGNYPHLVYHDITSLSFGDSKVDLIYVSHVIGYFDREEIISVLNEWKRVLKPNGILRIATPDFKVMARLYTEGKFPLKNFLGPLYGKMKMNSKVIYHKTAYDFESLKELLESIGFRNVKYYDWRQTEHAKFDDHSQAYLPSPGFIPTSEKPFDKENGYLISLNVEAEK